LTIRLNTEGLDRLIKAMKTPAQVKIGILGSGAGRIGGGPSNAFIGAQHEFGNSRVPMRSFLRVPLIDNLNKRIKEAGVLDDAAFRQAIETGNFKVVLVRIGIVGEAIVAEAFATGGFGKWPPLQADTLAHKKNHQILVETQQLRNSISSEVVIGS